jgi:hypothetical protein
VEYLHIHYPSTVCVTWWTVRLVTLSNGREATLNPAVSVLQWSTNVLSTYIEGMEPLRNSTERVRSGDKTDRIALPNS